MKIGQQVKITPKIMRSSDNINPQVVGKEGTLVCVSLVSCKVKFDRSFSLTNNHFHTGSSEYWVSRRAVKIIRKK